MFAGSWYNDGDNRKGVFDMKLQYMDRDTTSAIKGIALIFMFIHHFFTFPEFLIEGIQYPWIQNFADSFVEPMKMCVPVFSFLTGYFYAINRNRTLRYTIRKITDLYVSYWFVYLPILAFAVITSCWEFSLRSFVFEMAALKMPLMVFCWYVVFYSYCMLLLLVLAKEDNNPVEDVLYLLVLPVVISNVLSGMYLEGFLNTVVQNIREWYPAIASGYLCAKYGIFEKIFDRGINRYRHTGFKILTWTALAVATVAGRYWCRSLCLGSVILRTGEYPIKLAADFFLAPMFVYSAARLLQYVKSTVLMKILNQIGKYSLHMWFLHCIFFNACQNILQPILYWPRNPVLVLIWGLFLCYLPAILLDKLIVPVNKLKNRFL